MKNKFLAFGMAAFMIFAVTACDNGDDPGTMITNLIGGKATVDGTNIRFFVNADLPPVTARAAVGDTFTPVSGKLEYGNTVIKIEGFYDPVSCNFTFSGASGNYAFEFFGVANVEGGGGPAQAAGKIKIKDSNGVWTEEMVMFDFDSSILVNGTEAASPTGLPEKWTGKWTCEDKDEDEFFRGNNQLREQWGTGGDMIITSHSFSFWFDVQDRLDYIESDIQNTIDLGYTFEDYGGEQNRRNQLMVEQIYNRQAAFSIYEITPNQDGFLDVLASKTTMRPDYDEMGKFIADQKFVKLRFIEGTGEYGGELWIVMCTFSENPWDTSTDDIGEARAGTNFDYDRENWGLSDNYNLFVMKR